MKKMFKRIGALLIGLISVGTAVAQEMPQMPPMPVDSAVRVGVLPNGLTYYIRHNEDPKGQADFYIAQKVGSVLEEDNQRGLAHFLEHMCFNGTTNFPGKNMINWLESVGVKFGKNLNAATGIESTVYNISNVPVARKTVQDSCLLILHDWADAVTLDPKEIDAERGVIHEEWRRSMTGQMRLYEQLLPKVYPNSRYGHRLPIGTMEVVDNFEPKALRDYYEKWYRPDLQGIIVVGDIDPDYIEGKIKQIFSDIKMPENAAPREYFTVEDTPGTIYAIGKDKEMGSNTAILMFKTDPMLPREMRNTQAYYPINYMKQIIGMMLRERLTDAASKPGSEFASVVAYLGNFFVADTKDALMVQLTGKEGNITPAIKAVYRELLRASRGGFTQGEFDRANAELRSRMQRMYDSRNNTPTSDYSNEYVDAFIENNPIAGIEVEKMIMDQLTQMMPLQAINQVLPELIKPDNRVVMVMVPDAPNYVVPTEQELADGIAAVEAENIEPLKDTMKSEPLIAKLGKPGKIVSEKHSAQWDATELTLSNGVKVVLKPTKYKANDIQFEALAKGGFSVFPAANAPSIVFMPYAMMKTGFGTYDNSDLKKYLQGKQASLSPEVKSEYRSVRGTTTVADLPVLMELIYSAFTQYNITADDFAAAQSMVKAAIANQENTPEYKFSELIYSVLYKAPAMQELTSADIEKANRDLTVKMIREMFANPREFTFTFVGDFDPAVIKPLLEKYVASLPVGKAFKGVKNPVGFNITKGDKTTEKSIEMSTPQVWTMYEVSAEMPYTAKNFVIGQIAGQVVSKRLLEKVREEMGATYSIGAGSRLSRVGNPNFTLQIPFPMKPEMKNEVLAAVNAILADYTDKMSEADLNSIKEFMVKEAKEGLEDNSEWCETIGATTLNGVNVFTDKVAAINSVTVNDLKAFWAEVLKQNNRQLILLEPAAK